MNPGILLPMLVVLFAGGMIALQAPTNAILARAGGSPVLAALISFAVGTAGLLCAWLASGNRPGVKAFGCRPMPGSAECTARSTSLWPPLRRRGSGLPR